MFHGTIIKMNVKNFQPYQTSAPYQQSSAGVAPGYYQANANFSPGEPYHVPQV